MLTSIGGGIAQDLFNSKGLGAILMAVGGDMPWYRVEIPESESAIALMNAFEGAYIAALSSGEPTDVSVHHREEGGHVYYFSPGASKLAPELLREWNATACATDPDLSDFVEIRI